MKNSRIVGSASTLNLGGLEQNEANKVKVYVRSKRRINSNYKPHKTFQNWTVGYRIPWICFIEIAMMISYLLIGYLNELDKNDFTIDFTKVTDKYFLSGYDFDEPEELSNSWVGRIYFKEKFIEIAQSTGDRLFSFPESLPLSSPFTSNDVFNVEVVTIGGEVFDVAFDRENKTLVTPFANAIVDIFAQMIMSMKYRIQVSSVDQEEQRYIEISIIGEFTRDTDSDQIILDFYHTRIPHDENGGSYRTTLDGDLQFIFPFMIIIFGVIAIVLTLFHTREVYYYSKEKAERNFQRISAVFWTKYDKWSLFSLFCHTFTVISCILFIIYGHLYTDQLPFTNVLMCLCSSLHCFLLFRYLQQKPSTMIIVNVIFNAALTFLQFLVGCMVVFAAYLILGCSMFGTSCVNFATFTQGAVVLIAVIHGDSIQDLYDSVMTRSDVPWWCGFVYMSVWVFFSLTIMFNISISIFEESLTREIYKQSDKGHSDEPAPIEALTMNLPRSYRTIF